MVDINDDQIQFVSSILKVRVNARNNITQIKHTMILITIITITDVHYIHLG